MEEKRERKKNYHEDLGLDAIDRLRLVRDTRTDVVGHWTLRVRDSDLTLEVKNYSAFGLKGYTTRKDVPEIFGATLYIENIPMADLQLRRTRHEDRAIGYEYGFEILGEPLNIGAIRGYAEGSELIQKLKVQKYIELPDAFKKFVYESKELFETLEHQINEDYTDYGVTQGEILSYQESFARVIADYLTPLLDKKFYELATILKTMNDSTSQVAGEFFRKTLHRFLHMSPFADRSIKKAAWLCWRF